MKPIIQQRLTDNLRRVDNLVRIYRDINPSRQGRRSAQETDVLRAAVVLLHASMEDFLRSLARWKLPEMANKEFLDKIPFLGSESKRAEKVNLGYLLQYKEKTVDEFICESIYEYLNRSNFNKPTELSTFLEQIGVPPNEVNSHFGTLQEMMKRRHLIVHRADQDDVGGRGNHRVKSINENSLNRWIQAVSEFGESVLNQIPD